MKNTDEILVNEDEIGSILAELTKIIVTIANAHALTQHIIAHALTQNISGKPFLIWIL